MKGWWRARLWLLSLFCFAAGVVGAVAVRIEWHELPAEVVSSHWERQWHYYYQRYADSPAAGFQGLGYFAGFVLLALWIAIGITNRKEAAVRLPALVILAFVAFVILGFVGTIIHE